MPRAPFQVLVLPFRKTANQYQFALFRRKDPENYWQWIAGGGEGNETPLDAAKREAFEEAGIPRDAAFYPLDTLCCIPKFNFFHSWPDEIYVVPEYSFVVDAAHAEIAVSHEHDAFLWTDYEQAQELLQWDSNKTALWELAERLKTNDLARA